MVIECIRKKMAAHIDIYTQAEKTRKTGEIEYLTYATAEDLVKDFPIFKNTLCTEMPRRVVFSETGYSPGPIGEALSRLAI